MNLRDHDHSCEHHRWSDNMAGYWTCGDIDCPGGRLVEINYEAVEDMLTVMIKGIAEDLGVPVLGLDTIPEMARLYVDAALGFVGKGR